LPRCFREGEAGQTMLETQNVTADNKGGYTAQLGASKSEGLPLDLFTSGVGDRDF
jgi:hypothetical protein